MSEVVPAAGAAIASVFGSLLTFIFGICRVKRWVWTSNDTPLGPALDSRLELVEFRLTRIEDSVEEARDRVPFEEGRPWPTPWPPRGPN
ncbi:MAG TPA: hypothetical protein VGT40_25785 [Methylomirabilota bacterium]|nr:hypothetical protein [Methylomirabilota bacterium]